MYLQYRQAEVARLREELTAAKFVTQPAHDITNSDPSAPSPQAVNGNTSPDDAKRSSVVSKANTLSSLQSGSIHHAESAPPTSQVFLFDYYKYYHLIMYIV